MRKPTFGICKNKDADQLCGDREADQHLCFCIRDQLPTSRRSVADRSPTSQQLVADRWQGNFSWQLVADQAPTFADNLAWRQVGDNLVTYATSSRSNLVAASLLCMFKRQLTTDFNRQLVGDFKKTFPGPLHSLRNFSF